MKKNNNNCCVVLCVVIILCTIICTVVTYRARSIKNRIVANKGRVNYSYNIDLPDEPSLERIT